MKKFTITNNITHTTFVQYGETLVESPAFGLADRWVSTKTLSNDEITRVVATRPAPTLLDKDATESLLPSERTVIETNPAQEIHERKMVELRNKRNKLIAATDFTQLVDAPLTSAEKQAMRDYRQALRDLPESITDVDNVVWPVKPEVQ